MPRMRKAFSVVVPVFNEGPLIGSTIERLQDAIRHLRGRYTIEIVVVDDGSRDESAPTLAAILAAEPEGLRIVTHEHNRGLTEAIKTGCRSAAHATVVVLDADLSYGPEIIESLVDTREATGAAAVLASPYMAGGRVANVPLDRLVYSRLANFLLSLCVGRRIKTFTGMVRAYDTVQLGPILERRSRGEFNAWIIAELLRARATIVEVPAALVWPAHRSQSPSRMTASAFARRVEEVAQTVGTLLAAERSARSGDRT